MVFSSIEFLFLFLPLVLGAYFVAPSRLKNGVLAVGSLLFYVWGGGALVFLLLVSIVVDYACGWLVDWAHENSRRGWRATGVVISVSVNVGLLGYFKYANFIAAQLNILGESWGLGVIAWDSIVLPIGISFYTFQSMSYTIDIARGSCRHLRNPLDFALFVALFPQLIAGPIVRYHEIASQISARSSTVHGFSQGALRFVHGLVKKVVIADAVGEVARAVYAAQPETLSSADAWIGCLAYTVQIYFDFSGYSDMAIGLGQIFGFRLPENFRRPYSAQSVTDFWRRWHITLSNWFRDYLYIPLGGSRGTAAKTYASLCTVFVVTGIWHGANWTFVVWGIYHGMLLLLERRFGMRHTNLRGPLAWVHRARTFVLVIIGWVVFRADSLTHALAVYTRMFHVDGQGLTDGVADVAGSRVLLTLVVGLAVVLLPSGFSGARLVTDMEGAAASGVRLGLAVFAGYAILLIASGTFSPFLYFQF